MNPVTETVKKRDLVITLSFAAPLEMVWKAWSDPALIMRWWGPDGFSCPSCEMDFREGGTSLVCMRSPDGIDMYSTWKYTSIVPLQQIEYVQFLTDKNRVRIDPTTIGVRDDFPQGVRTQVVFRASGAGTEITVTEFGFPDTQMYVFAEMGLKQCLDKMAASLASA